MGDGKQPRRDRPGDAPVRLDDPRQLADEQFAGNPNDDRASQRAQQRQPRQQRQIIFGRLGEPNAGIDGDVAPRDPRRLGRRDPGRKLGSHLGGHVVVAGQRGHRRGVVPHMHQHHRTARLRHHPQRVRIIRQCRDVVDNPRTGIERGPHGCGVPAVDGDADALGGEAAHDWDDAPALLLGRRGRGTGTGAFAADIDDDRALPGHFQPGGDGAPGIEMRAAVAETVGGNVEDAHDRGRICQPGPEGPGGRRGGVCAHQTGCQIAQDRHRSGPPAVRFQQGSTMGQVGPRWRAGAAQGPAPECRAATSQPRFAARARVARPPH